ncbi:MAG: RNA-dependent DNA polymerase [bacterium]|nr:RNA-dependent DNA polymerase [bacterium]
MRRLGQVWPHIVDFTALLQATRRAAQGKRSDAAVARFLGRLEPEVLRLQRELSDGRWQPGPIRQFSIRDPKPRLITAVPFRDRVVHHALLAPLEPWFDRRMIDDSFACRRGKGTHAALDRAQQFVRRHHYFLKLDIRSFFDSIPHASVRASLARLVKDRRVLTLCDTILRGSSTDPGLPIGSLTSQWFANMLLDPLDHLVTEGLRVPGYVRYMDDSVLFADDRDQLWHAHSVIEAWLRDGPGLRLKSAATVLAPASEGLPFLGWRIYPRLRRIRPQNLRRYRWRLAHRRWQYERGDIDESSYCQSVNALVSHLSHGDTRGLRAKWFCEHDIDI